MGIPPVLAAVKKEKLAKVRSLARRLPLRALRSPGWCWRRAWCRSCRRTTRRTSTRSRPRTSRTPPRRGRRTSSWYTSIEDAAVAQAIGFVRPVTDRQRKLMSNLGVKPRRSPRRPPRRSSSSASCKSRPLSRRRCSRARHSAEKHARARVFVCCWCYFRWVLITGLACVCWCYFHSRFSLCTVRSPPCTCAWRRGAAKNY